MKPEYKLSLFIYFKLAANVQYKHSTEITHECSNVSKLKIKRGRGKSFKEYPIF